MKALSTRNDDPKTASRPFDLDREGFVLGEGSGAIILEELEHAKARGAKIYAEVLGGAINSGGQRGGGSMTAPNSEAVQRCIQQAVAHAGIGPSDIDTINGHLTATTKDALEIENWAKALGRSGKHFPLINSFKGAIGHCLAAAGSIECVASVLQFKEDKVFGTMNAEDLHPDIEKMVDSNCIPQKTRAHRTEILAKASFGFGDVNACIIFKRY